MTHPDSYDRRLEATTTPSAASEPPARATRRRHVAAVTRRRLLRFGAAAGTATAAAVAGAAVFPASASAAQVAGDTTGPTNPAVTGTNPDGAQLQLVEVPGTVTAPLNGNFAVGSMVNFNGALYQCIGNNGTNTEWISTAVSEIVYLPSPVRIYATGSDVRGKMSSGQVRNFDVSKKQNGSDSGVPADAAAALLTIQIQGTSAGTGWLAVAAKGADLSGFSSVVWSSANFAAVTPVASLLSTDSSFSIKCFNGSTHLSIDIVGYQLYYYYVGDVGGSRTGAGAAPRSSDRTGSDLDLQRFIQRRTVARRSLSR